MTHYLLTIHKLKEERGFARVTDIARELGLTKGSVSTALGITLKKNLVSEEEDCKFLILTDDGHDEVHKILSTRTLMYYFLKDFLGVGQEVADRDSCEMEHLMSQESIEKLFQFMKNLSEDKDAVSKFLDTNNLSLDLTTFNTRKTLLITKKVISTSKTNKTNCVGECLKILFKLLRAYLSMIRKTSF